jgi:sterol desaturase/sphingolipid hydroxylase (fatty acid hydroxylase superfamily)
LRKAWRRRHLVSNVLLTGITLGLNFALNAGAVITTGWLDARGFGALSTAPWSLSSKILVGVVALDATTYVCHRLMHVLPPLWKVHSVHHSDSLVDVTTALRFHPIETAWRFAFIVIPAWLLGLPMEALAIYRVLSAFMAIVEHTNVKLWQPLDTALSLLVGTPNMHKLHHSRHESETNTNYGNILSLFDRALSTFTPSARAEFVDSGLEGYDGDEVQRFGGLLSLPFRRPESSAAPSAAAQPAQT